MAEVIRLEGVRKGYGGGEAPWVEVLHGVDLVLHEGEFVSLAGPSGSGKSTLLNIMGLLEPPNDGALTIAGERAEALDDDARTRLRNRYLGFVFQFHHLLPAFSALENVLMPVFAGTGRLPAGAREHALALLERVGLAEHAGKRPVQLSGGQQQRVAIVRALANRPRLVLADEPTGNLDTQTAAEVFALMHDINREQGVTFLVVTHDERLAQDCPRRVNLVDGRIAPSPALVG
ncbi:lipoprotein-releasing system ATP-binding protein [Crenobacter luteus]|uniref:ABC transporter ATP-binding protein n=1 Tax=Crenobacter luteus TaxID=1452487 RepID=A0A163C4F1_9NEIS|nr:ABC transporter ATP-binding protein [Crenobacter luteus]KZE30036.1 ABC transporter ATP-binding protein [Crenobacter luteus]TCP11008.1 lipoprotein-releasing system ATP-binding protein [Crenobacter luteus]